MYGMKIIYGVSAANKENNWMKVILFYGIEMIFDLSKIWGRELSCFKTSRNVAKKKEIKLA